MENMIKMLRDVFKTLSENTSRSNELGAILKDVLNKGFENRLVCEKVFICKGTNEYKEPIIVIPVMPTSEILEIDTLKYYDLEININSFDNIDRDGYTIDEIIAWLLHEICENLITDNTLVRFKKMIITKYDQFESAIKSVIRNVGYLTWISIFSRTAKSYINDISADFYSSFLTNKDMYEYRDIWNSALARYISKSGGDNNILTEKYIKYKDNSDFLTFNKLARRYSSYALKYNDTEYSTFTKYLIAKENSELLKHYISREPKHLALFKEKEIFNVFNDNKILYESAETKLMEAPKTRSFVNEFSELVLDVNNVITTSDKIRVAVKLKDFSTDLTKAIETDILNNEVLQDLREKVNTLIKKLSDTKVEPTIMEEFI